jgi:hypothetical protein
MMSGFDSLPQKIKTKLQSAGLLDLPAINDDLTWNHILNRDILSLEEVRHLRKDIINAPTSTLRQGR